MYEDVPLTCAMEYRTASTAYHVLFSFDPTIASCFVSAHSAIQVFHAECCKDNSVEAINDKTDSHSESTMQYHILEIAEDDVPTCIWCWSLVVCCLQVLAALKVPESDLHHDVLKHVEPTQGGNANVSVYFPLRWTMIVWAPWFILLASPEHCPYGSRHKERSVHVIWRHVAIALRWWNIIKFALLFSGCLNDVA